MSTSHESDEAILAATRHLSEDERTVYLETVCGDDPKLRRRVESLIARLSNEETETATQITSDGNRPTEGQGPTGTVLTDDDATVTDIVPLPLPAEETIGDAIGRYKLLEQIGEGGFGLVYVAEQTEPITRLVALKIIKLGMDTRQVIGRFEAERQTLALMDHPNIARVLDGGATNTGRPYFVMELVRGTKITQHCDTHRLSIPKRLDLFMMVCRAIEHAHQKGIIHRDIKPSNILVTIQDGVAVPKVIDFGIAKATQGSLGGGNTFTQFDQFIGTPAYMSPEQADGSALDIDTRSDIYSLGVLLYELLTGETPLESKNLLARGFDEMRRLIREGEPQKPSIRLHKLGAKEQTTTAARHGTDAPRLIKMVEGDLDWVVMKCLEKDRNRRYASAAQLLSEIQRYLNDEPVVARPPSNWYRLTKMVRRNRLAFAAGGFILLSLVIALFVTSWFVVKEKQERDNAERASKNSDSARRIAVAEEQKAEASQKEAEQARHQAEAARLQAEAALEQARADRNLALAAQRKAETSRKEAEAAREQAEQALKQSREDRNKAGLAEKQAQSSDSVAQSALQAAKAAQALEAAEAVQLDQATKAAAEEAALQAKTEAALKTELDSRQKAEADAAAASAQVRSMQQSVSNFLVRLEALPPGPALSAGSAFFSTDDAPQPWAARLSRDRGEWRARQWDWTNALAEFSHAAQLDPSDRQAKDSMALLSAEISNTNLFPLIAQGPEHVDLTAGLVHLRKGDFSAAAELFNKALATSGQDSASQAEIFAALAIARQQLKQTDNARANLQACQQLLVAKMPKAESGDLGVNWREWLMAQSLAGEASALLEVPAPPK